MKLRHQALRFVPAVMLVCGLLPGTALAQFTQQGLKLVGTGAIGDAFQGYRVSLSGDGNTAIVGGPEDNSLAGAAWVYTRSGGVWSQQAKLVSVDAYFGCSFGVQQGGSVALSRDGNTALVGGSGDNNCAGAAWVYTRSGGVWSQQAKLVGTGAVGGANQGLSVSLSSDGNTAIVGGNRDNSDIGAAWVYIRSGAAWTQQAKLVGTGVLGPEAEQGEFVSLSSDGNTAIVGGPTDNYNNGNRFGAAWVFTRSTSGVWSQQAKLVGTDAIGPALQGYSVSLSGDGNTAIVGGPEDNSYAGAAWVYTRSGGVWSQQAKLVGTGAVGGANQGFSGALSSDGNTAIVGGPTDNYNNGTWDGAAWIFTRSTSGVWSQLQAKLVGTGAVGGAEQFSFAVRRRQYRHRRWAY